MSTSLHVKYRPKSFKTVVGQDSVIKSLTKILERDGSHSFLFSGPSGTGKTTLARIAAKELGCSATDIIEIDGATNTGVDDMRDFQQVMQYLPLGGGGKKALILDECHMLSKQAWNSLLKITEEPPKHAYFFFCTTEPGKVINTIKTRCASFTLDLLSENELHKVLERVSKKEEIKLPIGVADVIVKEANGSPRQLLVNLEAARDATDKKEASQLLHSAVESDATIELCRFLVKGGTWMKAMAIVEKLKTENPESVRIVVSNYVASATKNSKSDKDACRFLSILEAFSQPYNSSDKIAPLLLSIGRVLFGE